MLQGVGIAAFEITVKATPTPKLLKTKELRFGWQLKRADLHCLELR